MISANEDATVGAAAPSAVIELFPNYTGNLPFSEDPYLPIALEEFKDHKMWVCFDLTPQNDGKTKKIPINPHTGRPAKSNDPSTWGTFHEAKNMMKALDADPGALYKPRYLGFALTEEAGLIFLDLDHVIDSATGFLVPQAIEIVEKVDSYVEYSQSRTGLHIYARGHKTSTACRAGFLEVYDRSRFACITNDVYGEVRPLREATAEITEICDHYFLKSPPQHIPHQEERSSAIMEDELILKIASSAKNGSKFKRLYYEGSIAEYGDDESAADQALMNLLVFYTRDQDQLERLFSGSALGQRGKWMNRPDYRKRTITSALAYVAESYKGGTDASPDRPEIVVCPGNLPIATGKAEEVLLKLGTDIFQRGGRLVRVVTAATKPSESSILRSEDAYIITDVNFTYLTEVLTQKALWVTVNSKGKKKDIDCPEKISKTLIARGQWRLPVLRGLIHAPTLRTDGSVLDRPGYDPISGLLFLSSDTRWEPILENPTLEDAKCALKKLRALLEGFPFANPESESVAVSGILTSLVRKSIATAPMHGFTAPKMGSGKSLLADAIALIATGKPNSVLSAAENEIEERKRLLSVLMEGDLMICYDNIEKPFGSPSLCSILTQREFKDRVLGCSSTASVPTDSCFLATGNNLTIVGDLSTRTLLCQLDPKVEHPEERSFAIDLHQYIPEHRPQLLHAGLTILKAYDEAGRPSQNIKQFGRFEDWSDWVRSAIVWVGMPDPCLTRREIEATDPVRTALGTLFSSWYALFHSYSIKIKALVAKANETGEINSTLKEALIELAGTPNGEINERSLSNKLKHYKNRIEQGYRLETAGELQGTTLWRITKV